MKRNKKLLAMVGVLAAVSLVTLCVSKYEEKQEQIRTSDEIIMKIPKENVTAIRWKYDDVELAFHKDDQWLYDSDSAFPVDTNKIENLLETFEELGAAFTIEAPEDTAAYGMNSPTCTIQLDTQENSYTITLGNFSTLDSQRYVSIGNGNVYLVKKDPMDVFRSQLSDYIKHDEIPDMYRTTQFTFTGAESYTVYYQEDSNISICKDDVYFTNQNGVELPLKTSNVNGYVNTVEGLPLSDYASYNVTEEELTAFGLSNPALSADIQYENENGDSRTFTFSIGQNQEELKAAENDENAVVTCYFRVGQSQIVYTITQSKYDALLAASYNDLRHNEVLTADFADVTSMDITLENATYSITSSQEEDKDERHYFYQDEELEELELSTLRTAARSMRADSFTDEKASGKVEISVTYYLDNETHPQVQITLYRYDGTNCLAVVDSKSVCLVPRTSVVDLIEAVNAIVLG